MIKKDSNFAMAKTLLDKLRVLGLSKQMGLVLVLFATFGFIASHNDPLIVTLRGVFALNTTQGLSVHFVGFAAYGLLSLPAAAVLDRLGYAHTIVLGLGVALLGCALVSVLVGVGTFPAVLAALFVLASGLTIVQVAANPLAAALGDAGTSHFRVGLAQSLNSLGVVMGSYAASQFLLKSADIGAVGEGISPVRIAEMVEAVSRQYLGLALVVGAVAAAFALRRKGFASARVATVAAGSGLASVFGALVNKTALFGALAIALYVGAEVAIGSIMISFLHREDVLGVSLAAAGAHLATYYWGGALVGRFVGAALLSRFRADYMLGICALCAAFLCVLAALLHGSAAGYAALSVGLFNSIMFPTIFSLTMQHAKLPESSVSGLLCLAIAGGAFLPLLVGKIADNIAVHLAFLVPAMAYAVILAFALGFAKRGQTDQHP